MFNHAKFLIELVGPDGALALAKASDRSEALGKALVPRTIVSWLRAVDEFHGEIPGSDSLISFAKSENGFDGYVQLEGGSSYFLKSASLFHVAGAIAFALNLDTAGISDEIRRLDLEKLGKSIDQMVKVEQTKRAKVSAGQSRPEESSAGDEHGETSRQEVFQNDDKSLRKESLNPGGGAKGGTGTTAGPVAPAAPAAPTASAPKMSTKQALPKPAKSAQPPGAPTVKLTRSEQAVLCPVCVQPQFHSGEFTGCLCFRSLAKSATVTPHDDVMEVKFGSEWDRDAILTLLESVGRK
jgi:hypothetical protein